MQKQMLTRAPETQQTLREGNMSRPSNAVAVAALRYPMINAARGDDLRALLAKTIETITLIRRVPLAHEIKVIETPDHPWSGQVVLAVAQDNLRGVTKAFEVRSAGDSLEIKYEGEEAQPIQPRALESRIANNLSAYAS